MCTMTLNWIVSIVVLTGSIALAEIDTSTRFPNFQNINFDNLPGNFSVPGNLPVNISKVPTIEEGEKLFQEKCKKMGRPEAYEAAQAAKDEVQECVKSLVNVTELQTEMEHAKPTGDLDVVFRKYCRKSPQLQYCITNFTASIEPCLDEQEKENKHLIQNITDSIIKFICFKEGDRIALFIAEGGPECLSANQEAIQNCVNSTVTKNMPKDTLSIDNLPSLVIGEEQCRDIRTLQTCVVKALETCSEPTPANIIDSMFNFVRKMTPCSKMKNLGPGDMTRFTLEKTQPVTETTIPPEEVETNIEIQQQVEIIFDKILTLVKSASKKQKTKLSDGCETVGTTATSQTMKNMCNVNELKQKMCEIDLKIKEEELEAKRRKYAADEEEARLRKEILTLELKIAKAKLRNENN